MGAVVVVALVPQQVQGDVGQRERRHQGGQAESLPGRTGDRVGEGDDQVGVEDQSQGEGGGGPSGDDATFEAACGQGVVDRVAEASASRNGEVFGGGVALEAQRARGERVARPDGDDEPVRADEAVTDVGESRRAGARFEVDLTPAQLGVVRPGFRGHAQPHAGRLAVDGGDQGGAGRRGQGIVPAHGEHPFQGRQIEFLLRGEKSVGLLYEGVDLGVHGQRAGGGDHAAAGADQDLVPGGLADAAQERLIAGEVTWRRAAAPATLPSSSRASKAVSRFKSSCMTVTLQVISMHLLLMIARPTFEVRGETTAPLLQTSTDIYRSP